MTHYSWTTLEDNNYNSLLLREDEPESLFIESKSHKVLFDW